MKAINLKTEYLTNPIGIDIENPRFSWNCEGGIKQKAYRIVAKRWSYESTKNDIVWDSGKIKSNAMTHISYAGKPLNSRDIVKWQVILWDENDEIGEISEASFEMGLLKPFNWKGKFISGDYNPNKKERYPLDCFRKYVKSDETKKIVKVRMYATAHGVYSVRINDKRLDDFVLAPGITDYRKRLQYQTYDITKLIKDKNFTVEIYLGDGWYRGSSAAYGVTNVYGIRTSVLAQIEILYSDGTMDIIPSDCSWDWSNEGPARFADLKDGEIYDASRIIAYNKKATEVKSEKGVAKAQLVASNNVPVKYHEHFKAKKLVAEDGAIVYDFSQNIAGVLQFHTKANKGSKIKLVCGEVLDEKGHVDLSGIQEMKPEKGWNQMSLIKKLTTNKVDGKSVGTPLQQIEFTASGDEDFYRNEFSIFGFRYAEISGDFQLEEDEIEAIAVYSDMEDTGKFECSNKYINKLHENTKWSMKGNFLDIPTDCPTRERLGWTGDGQIFFNTGSYMMDVAAFMKKWMQDMEDAKYKNGLVSAVFPYEGVELMYKATGSSVGWADIIYLLPYRYYKRYGDIQILKSHWGMIKGYADYLIKNLGLTDKKQARENPYNEYTYEKGMHLGEWLEPEEFRDKVYKAGVKHPEECTAYLHLAMTIIGEIADILGEEEYVKICKKYGDGSKEAYNYLFVKNDGLKTKRQAKLVRPLAFDLLDGDEKEKANRYLVEAVVSYDYCVGTGFLSTPFILPVLTKAGRLDVAYKMLENEKKPGWLGEIKDGATTVWENWEGDLSQNHYSPGAVCEWLYDTVAGINVDGKNHFRISPMPGGSLNFARATYRSIYGTVYSSWIKNGESYNYEIEIPANTTAKIILPNGLVKEVEAGKYYF